MVVATQNSEEHYGTYPLPESQMDRFTLRIRIDYPSAEDEKGLILEAPAVTDEALAKLQRPSRSPKSSSCRRPLARVRLSPELAGYIVDVARETRRSPFLALGLSPRAELAWRNVARASRWFRPRLRAARRPQQLALPALAHRLVLANQLDSTGRRARGSGTRRDGRPLSLPIPG